MNYIYEYLKLVLVDKIDFYEIFEFLRLEKMKSSIEVDDFICYFILVIVM